MYCIEHHTKELTPKIVMVQHRAARFACRDYERKSSVTKLPAELEWDTLKLRIQAARLTPLYKITSEQVAIQRKSFSRQSPDQLVISS